MENDFLSTDRDGVCQIFTYLGGLVTKNGHADESSKNVPYYPSSLVAVWVHTWRVLFRGPNVSFNFEICFGDAVHKLFLELRFNSIITAGPASSTTAAAGNFVSSRFMRWRSLERGGCRVGRLLIKQPVL